MTARTRSTFLLYATVQFVVLTCAAMLAYAGGTLDDPTTTHYGFFSNFFSDLGTTRSYSGRANGLSCALFVVALVTIGAALVAFSGAWKAFAFQRERVRIVGHLSRIFGTISGLCFIGIALTPWNLVLDLHNTLVLAAFSWLLGYVACLTVLLAANGSSRLQLGANVVYLIGLFGYVWLLFFGPNLRTAHGHLVQVTGQKTIVYASMVNLMVQSFVTRRLSPR